MTTEPTHYLDLYDDLDLGKPEERRLAVYLLEEYFGQVMTNVGELVGVNLHRQSVDAQWGIIARYLETHSDSEEFSHYQSEIMKLDGIRNRQVAHNFKSVPNRDRLDEIRNIAEDWRVWIEETATVSERVYGDAMDYLMAILLYHLDLIEDNLSRTEFISSKKSELSYDEEEHDEILRSARKSVRENKDLANDFIDDEDLTTYHVGLVQNVLLLWGDILDLHVIRSEFC